MKYLGEKEEIIDLNENISPQQWKDFFENICFRDFMNTFHMRLALTRDELEEAEGSDYFRLQGDARTLRFALGVENIINQELQEKEKKDESSSN